ncbi:hypothetical protein GAYE_SCF31G4934 [Galdieria yellowstonensis]|uniref:Transcription activator GCR1-like domain-containing protein n=1 Tax=Galdieria yellowstonensis TaxID=3028027 RepID=A0AAV9IHZ7_9RHOD|nr:hypothetical protein GAYE_SCF31G4934 [Galdieria yellowstonensis]
MSGKPKRGSSAYIMECSERQYLQYASQNGLEMGSSSVISFIQSLVAEGDIAPATLRSKISALRVYLRKNNITLDDQKIREVTKEYQKKKAEARFQQQENRYEPFLPENRGGPKLTSYADLSQIKQVASSLNGAHRLAFLARVFTASRISTLQNIFFANLSYYELNGVGGLKIESNLSKTNSFDRRDFIHVIRHRDPELCTIGELARLMVAKYKYNIPSANEKPFAVDYKEHNTLIKSVHKANNINLANVTHSCRHFAANYMRSKGVPHSEIQQQGLWSTDDVTARFYLTRPPEAAIKALANVESSVDIPRSLVTPSFEMLKRLCFHWLEPSHRFYRFIGTVYLQDAAIIPIPELERDEEFRQFKNQILFSKDRDEKTKERLRIRQEVLQELEEQGMIRRKKPKNSSYDPRNGIYMESYLTTVREVAEEYLFGIDNRESIQQLNRTRGSSWRRVSRERSFYCNRRKPIYILIEKLLKEYGHDKEAVLKRVDQDTKNVTIDEFLNSLEDGSYYLIHNMK